MSHVISTRSSMITAVFRIVVVLASVMSLSHIVTVSDIPGHYSVQRYQSYPDIGQTTLYDFVMFAETANKWMKFVTFVATDHKPVGAGKTYKAVIDSNIFMLTIVDHQRAKYVALENANKDDTLKLRVELRFVANSWAPCYYQEVLENCNVQQSTQLLPSNHLRTNATTGISQSAAMETRHLQNIECHPHSSSKGPTGSGLSIKFFLRHESFLFQNSIGATLRYFLGRHLNHSLANLVDIVPHVQRRSLEL
uniref:Uncharacterized protein n=1 Tax=Anopheles dirus TaxID=7168 RepID=A0A1Y9H2M1_9DIPT